MSCASPVGGPDLNGEVGDRTVIEGTITRDGEPVQPAYARLIDRSGEFTAEVPVSAAGAYRFFAAPGTWHVRVLYPGGAAEVGVEAEEGAITRADISVT